jgi:predicted transcriptional regulator of viral defense system
VPRPLDASIAVIAGRQHGVVALWQLIEVGLSASAVRSRVAAGKLHRVHRGVYAVGHRVLSMDGRRMAAVLACGPNAVASHRMAGALHGILVSQALEVTVPGRGQRRVPGVLVHRSRRLHPGDITTIDGIPSTSLGRTLVDYADQATDRQVERACEQAEVLRIYDQRAIEASIERNPGKHGTKRLLAVIAKLELGVTVTRNELEEAFLAICDRVGAPRPRVNAWIPFPEGGGAEVDFLWERERLIVELDGFQSHGTRRAFVDDRRRDRRLKLLRWEIARFTWQDVLHARTATGGELAALLALSR